MELGQTAHGQAREIPAIVLPCDFAGQHIDAVRHTTRRITLEVSPLHPYEPSIVRPIGSAVPCKQPERKGVSVLLTRREGFHDQV